MYVPYFLERYTPKDFGLNDRVEWERYLGEYVRLDEGGYDFDRKEKDGRINYFNILFREQTLTEHLEWQINLSFVEESVRVRSIIHYLIWNIDNNGYLEVSPEETASCLSVPIDDVERAITHLQTLDPPGIGARDLRECLMIQALRKGNDFCLPLKIVSAHFDLFSRLNIEEIARRLGISRVLVSEAFHKLLSLEPMPGRIFSRDQPMYIIPDARIFKVNDQWLIELNEDDREHRRLRPFYRNLLSEGDQNDNEVKEFLQKHGNISRWFMKSIQQRRQTLYKILKSIIKIQCDFLEHGPKYLKPLTLKDVAMDTSMSESTVSRITKETYLETPFGVIALRVFFSFGFSQQTQVEEISSTYVKAKIQEIISIEGKNRPLSDQELVQLLRDQGINIARRTVAKYREAMGIPASGERKRLFKMKGDI